MIGTRNVPVLRLLASCAGLGAALVAPAHEVAPDDLAAPPPEILFGGAIGALVLLIVGLAVMIGTDRVPIHRRDLL